MNECNELAQSIVVYSLHVSQERDFSYDQRRCQGCESTTNLFSFYKGSKISNDFNAIEIFKNLIFYYLCSKQSIGIFSKLMKEKV